MCVIDEVTNYIITAPMKHAKSEEDRRNFN